MRSEIGVTETDTPSQLRRPDRRQRAAGPRRMAATVDDDQVARAIDGIQALAAGARLQPQDASVAAPAALLAEVFGGVAGEEGLDQFVLRDHAIAVLQAQARFDAVAVGAGQ